MKKPIFSANRSLKKTAYLNWRIKKHHEIMNMTEIADGFFLSAMSLTKAALRNNKDKKADILIFPILTNAHHAIELYLKAMTHTLHEIEGSTYTIQGGHNLQLIYENLRLKVGTYGGSLTLKRFDKETANLKSYIDELHLKINATVKKSNMDFTRYPVDNKNDNHFYVETLDNVVVDLKNLSKRMKSISRQLENLSSYLFDIELHRGS